MSIDTILAQVLKEESGFVDNPADPGGATMYGITEKVARATGYAGDMSKLPLDFAMSIYRKQYVTAPGFDKVFALSEPIAAKLINASVNMGVTVPGTWLQRVLNVMNQQGKVFPDIATDGAIGPATLSSLAAYLKYRGAAGESVMVRAMNCLQGAKYIEIAKSRPASEAFVFGWLNGRVEN